MDLETCIELCKNLERELEDFRLNFQPVNLEAKSVAELTGITLDIPRTAGRQTQHSNFKTESPEEYFRLSILLPFLDYFISQLKDRNSYCNINAELHALYSSPDIIRNIKSRRLRWAGHVARMGESRNAYRVLVGRPEGKRPLGRPRRRWEDNIKMDLRKVGYDDRDWINLAQDRDRWRAYVRAAMNLRNYSHCRSPTLPELEIGQPSRIEHTAPHHNLLREYGVPSFFRLHFHYYFYNSPRDLTCFKYAPMTSADVERSSSMFLNVLSENRRSFTRKNLEMNIRSYDDDEEEEEEEEEEEKNKMVVMMMMMMMMMMMIYTNGVSQSHDLVVAKRFVTNTSQPTEPRCSGAQRDTSSRKYFTISDPHKRSLLAFPIVLVVNYNACKNDIPFVRIHPFSSSGYRMLDLPQPKQDCIECVERILRMNEHKLPIVVAVEIKSHSIGGSGAAVTKTRAAVITCNKKPMK
ncbi:hypothetical protein ANN_02703 [Periplaneta americana]|uniref:Uncharacterized protein n=1 Tax=Periplaneta americana TaxID=6978 RepID=A0ABQ8TWZ5_PERAM|nr:hypothetical protein ANN_02703 [Periplaneta americana]